MERKRGRMREGGSREQCGGAEFEAFGKFVLPKVVKDTLHSWRGSGGKEEQRGGTEGWRDGGGNHCERSG